MQIPDWLNIKKSSNAPIVMIGMNAKGPNETSGTSLMRFLISGSPSLSRIANDAFCAPIPMDVKLVSCLIKLLSLTFLK